MIFRSESPRLVTLRDDLRAVTVLNAILRVELPGDLVRRTPIVQSPHYDQRVQLWRETTFNHNTLAH